MHIILLPLLVLIFTVTGISEGANWCVCRSDISDPILQKSLDYACGAGADCTAILQNGACFQPNTVRAHCSYAVNSYFQRKAQIPGSCDFAGTAVPTATDPSYSPCSYPSLTSSPALPGTTVPPVLPGTTVPPVLPGATPPAFPTTPVISIIPPPAPPLQPYPFPPPFFTPTTTMPYTFPPPTTTTTGGGVIGFGPPMGTGTGSPSDGTTGSTTSNGGVNDQSLNPRTMMMMHLLLVILLTSVSLSGFI